LTVGVGSDPGGCSARGDAAHWKNAMAKPDLPNRSRSNPGCSARGDAAHWKNAMAKPDLSNRSQCRSPYE
jgi:DNA-binding CsgD family transcriptional regulator